MRIVIEKLDSEILDSLFEKCKSFIKSSVPYQDATKTIFIDSTSNDFKDIINKAYHNALSMEYLKDVPGKEFRESLLQNIEIISQWIYMIEIPVFDETLIRPSNYDYQKKIGTFFRSIYEYISENRKNYVSVSTEQLKEISGMILNVLQNHAIESRVGIKNLENGQEKIISLLQDMKRPIEPTWSLSEDLKQIENDIEGRYFQKAKTKLDFIENHITENNNPDECAKFYELYTNLLLLTERPQDAAIPYLEKLISFTTDVSKRKRQQTLLMILNHEYDEALECIETLLLEVANKKDKKYFYELKMNTFLLAGRTNGAKVFLDSISDVYSDSIIYRVRLLNSQGLYNEAQDVIEKNIDFFNESFSKKIIRIETLGYSYTQKYHDEGCCLELKDKANALISDCNFLLEDVVDDLESKEIILITKALLYRVVGKHKESLETYIKVKELNSDNPNFLRNYPLEILMNNGNLQEAIDYFKRFIVLYPNDYFIQEAYFDTLIRVDTKSAIDELEKYPIEVEALCVKLKLVMAYNTILEISKAENLISNLEQKFPNNYFICVSKGDIFKQKKKYAETFQEYKKALDLIPDENRRIVLIHVLSQVLLEHLPSFENVKYLISLFESIKNKYEMLAMFGYEYVHCFIIINDLLAADETIREIRKNELLTKDIIKEEIWCNFATQNYQKVIKLFEELNKFGGKYTDKDNKILLLSLLEVGETKKFIESIEYIGDCENEKEFLFTYQKVRNLGLIEKSIEIAHKGYVSYPQSLPLMEAFLFSVLGNSQKLSDEIRNDFFECRDKYFKIDREKRNIKEFYIPENATGNQIIEILMSAVPKKGAINYIGLLDEKRWHLSFLTITKFNYLYIWKSCQLIDGMKIYVSDGSLKNIAEANEKLNFISEIVIDLPSLVTFAHINILDLVLTRFSKIYVPQEAVNEIENIFQAKSNPEINNFHSCLYQLNENKYLEGNISLSDIENIAIKIKEFMNSEKVEKVGRQLAPINEFPEKLNNVLQNAKLITSETIRYAWESNLPIMLEGCFYKTLLGEFDSSISVLSFENLLYKLLEDKKISFMQFSLCIEKLIVSKYYCIPIDCQVLFHLYKYNGYLITSNFEKLINIFSDASGYNPEWTMNQLCAFLILIWNDNIPFENKKTITLKVFYVLIQRGDIPQGYFICYLKLLLSFIKTKQFKMEFKRFWKENLEKINEWFEKLYL